jgi:hypothetical protein
MSERDPETESRPDQKEESTGFLVGLGFLLVSGYFFVTSFFIPHPEGWQTAPGMLPMVLGGSLFVMAAVITWDTVRRGAIRNLLHRREKIVAESENSLRRVVIAVVIAGIFYFAVLPLLPFEVAAFVFLATMTQIFWREAGLIQRLLISLVVPFLITGSFQGIFGIPLPGDGSIIQEIMFWMKGQG